MFARNPAGIHALPIELLARVFVIGALDADPYVHSPFLLKPDQHYYAVPSTTFQLTVSHVCAHWRALALRTPCLWTTLTFREPAHIPRAATYLTRARPSAPNRLLHILIDTVAPEDHIPRVTLSTLELPLIFSLVMPHVAVWRTFHLKIRDNASKLIARQHLGAASPALHLETLQLYHFEDYRTAQNWYIATYRPPVRIFSNVLPRLRNVSLIGVNLPWAQSPYLVNLHSLQLALHSDNIRPPYRYWDRMLRKSPQLERLSLHYSGPRKADGSEQLAWAPDPSLDDNGDGVASGAIRRKGKEKADDTIVNDHILLDALRELSLTDLDPDYLCLVLERLVMPRLNSLCLNLPDQDFTPFVDGVLAAGKRKSDCFATETRSTTDETSGFGYIASEIDNDMSASQQSGAGTRIDRPFNGNCKDKPHSSIASSSLTTTSSPNDSRAHPLISTTSTRTSWSTTFPNLSVCLSTLIIIALECSFDAWKRFLWSLDSIEVLEVNFAKVRKFGLEGTDLNVLGASGSGSSRRNGDAMDVEEEFWKVLVDTIPLRSTLERGENRTMRMVLPKLRKCKIAGLDGQSTETLVRKRERERARTECRWEKKGDMEWWVVDDGSGKISSEIFERGIWVTENRDEDIDTRIGVVESGMWVKVRRAVEEEEALEEGDVNTEDGEESTDEGEL